MWLVPNQENKLLKEPICDECERMFKNDFRQSKIKPKTKSQKSPSTEFKGNYEDWFKCLVCKLQTSGKSVMKSRIKQPQSKQKHLFEKECQFSKSWYLPFPKKKTKHRK